MTDFGVKELDEVHALDTGHWLIERLPGGHYEAKCKFCGKTIPICVEFDIQAMSYNVLGLEPTCHNCKRNMFQKEQELFTEETSFCKTIFANGLDLNPYPYPQQLVINCDKILLEHNSLGLQVDISNSIENFDTVEINGIKFVREVK